MLRLWDYLAASAAGRFRWLRETLSQFGEASISSQCPFSVTAIDIDAHSITCITLHSGFWQGESVSAIPSRSGRYVSHPTAYSLSLA